MTKRRIHIALPVLDEMESLPGFLHAIECQSVKGFKLHVCVNQPEEWWEMDEKKAICRNNALAIEYLREYKTLSIDIIDKSSKGKGWIGRRHGVGWARKVLMDQISKEAGEDDLVVSLDADTLVFPGYLGSILDSFNRKPGAFAMAVPYYHLLTGDAEADRAILRYEIYMRNYSVNLWRIGSPYSYTALGSALAFPVWAYRRIGGMTPMMSGEDFYFLQKMVKAGPVLFHNREKVYPAARFSDRVYFGTGPAMIKGRLGDWRSYPVYHHALFDLIRKTYELFPIIFDAETETPVDAFLQRLLKEEDPWRSLRENSKERKKFVRACHNRFDGLRILQFLKSEQEKTGMTDETCLARNLSAYYMSEVLDAKVDLNSINFMTMPVDKMDKLRNLLAKIEEDYQVRQEIE